ncbi:hypothetical protein AO265_18335 [Pseudomonas sp. ABAC61]|nr:hypothetical protein AO265_18335 [Pseudomonas sp. ABAC61]
MKPRDNVAKFRPIQLLSTSGVVATDIALGTHLALVIEDCGTPHQPSFLLLIFIERQASTTQCLQCQLTGFLNGVRPQLGSSRADATGQDTGNQQQQDNG